MLNHLDNSELDYSDVLILPRNSEINSRKDVDIERVYSFKWGAKPIKGCGVVAANMFTTGTFEMAKEFQKNHMFTALHKHYSAEQLIEFLEKNKKEFGNNDYIFISTGLRNEDFKKLVDVMVTELCNNICLDAPNAYIPAFKAHLNRLRSAFPKSVILAGNIATGDGVGELIREGADIVKIGIGPGCFVKNTKIQTSDGLKNIQDIEIGDKVLTHKGIYENVTNTFIHHHHKKFIKINDIECTPDHKFYVIEKKDKDLITEKNLNEYAKFIEAKDLDITKHLLIRMTERLEFLEITKSEIYEDPQTTYDFEVGGENGSHSYNVNGIIVHNSQCNTRSQTGVGRPQLSAIIECADAAHGVDGMICADGGITNPGDICKAFGIGSDFVMVGGIIAGSNEAAGEKITKRFASNELDSNNEPIIEEKTFKINYGMASDKAQKLHYGGVQEYRANEGIVSLVPHTGPVQNTLRNIEGGLRSCMTYVGAKNLEELPSRVTFCKVNRQINRLKGSHEIE